MLLKKIILENIRSYKHEEIEFPKGFTLLSGDIGSGKTSILLGIEFALFGLQPGQRGTSLLRNGEQEGGVTIEFEIDGKEIIIERTLKRGKSVSQEYCSISIEGEKKEISVVELKNKILEILDYPKEFAKKQNLLYKFTVYTPQEEMKQIILEDAEARLNTLRHVFGVDKYKKILENISILTLKLREEKRLKEGATLNLEQDKLNKISKENELETKHQNLSSVERELFLKTEKRKEIQEEKESVSKKIEEKNKINQEIEKTKIMTANKKETILNNTKYLEQLKAQINKFAELKFNEPDIVKFDNEISFAKKEKEKLNDKKMEIISQIASINNKNEEIKKLEKKISSIDICPTCLQNVDSVYRANVMNKSHSDIVENNKKLAPLEEEKKKISESIVQIDSEISLKEKKSTELKILKIKLQEVHEKQKNLSESEKTNEALKKDIELLNQHIETLRKFVFELGRFDNLFELKKKELENALKEERVADIKVAELKKEIEVFSKQIEELKSRIKKTEETKKQLDYITELEDWFSEKFSPLLSFVEKNVMVNLKTKFSQLFSEWFSMLVSDTFNVTLDDNFTPVIEHQDYEIDYSYLSGGERTAIALAYRLALNQVINSLLSKIKTKDFVILDEPTDGFSDQQLDKMRDVLQQLEVNQLIIVSHEQKIESFVENILRFKKEGGISGREK